MPFTSKSLNRSIFGLGFCIQTAGRKIPRPVVCMPSEEKLLFGLRDIKSENLLDIVNGAPLLTKSMKAWYNYLYSREDNVILTDRIREESAGKGRIQFIRQSKTDVIRSIRGRRDGQKIHCHRGR